MMEVSQAFAGGKDQVAIGYRTLKKRSEEVDNAMRFLKG
jgi:hypothetical protein